MRTNSIVVSSFCCILIWFLLLLIPRSFLYNIVNVYLMLLAGSLFNALSDAIARPSSIILLAGSALPSVSIFFINVVISQLMLGVPLSLLRIGPLVVTNLYTRFVNQKTLSIRSVTGGPLAEASVDYGSLIPPVLYMTVIIHLYWVIAPIVLGIGALFFVAYYLVQKYQFLFVNVPQFETGGTFFYGLYGYTMASLLASAVTITAFMGIKQGAAQAPLLIPLPFMVLCAWRYTEGRHKILSENFALTSARRMQSAADEESKVQQFSNFFFRQPGLFGGGAKPMPYRVRNWPLFDDYGNLNDVYTNAVKIYCRDDFDEASIVKSETFALSNSTYF